MADSRLKMPKIKLIMGIIIPVFIMIATLIMVSVSFAWFSTSATTNIATINLTTTKVFTLGFSAGSSESVSYNGQTALGRDFYLISRYRQYTTEQLENYWDNTPFMFKTSIGLSTEGIPVDLNMNFKITQITYENGTIVDGQFQGDGNPYDLDIYGASSQTRALYPYVHEYDADKIPYAFTWFFVERNKVLDGDATLVYTPYGAMALASEQAGSSGNYYKYATALNGTAVNNTTSIENVTPSGILNFTVSPTEQGENRIFDFYVVFAPEKLFWMQFFPADRAKAATTVYTETELLNYISRGSTVSDCNKMYYSATTYIGATFNFTAEVNVTEVHWPASGA